jgi:hypothetical protein
MTSENHPAPAPPARKKRGRDVRGPVKDLNLL